MGLTDLISSIRIICTTTLSQLRIFLEVVLPLRTFDMDKALEMVRWIQYKNHLAYQSHRKRKVEEIAALSEMSS